MGGLYHLILPGERHTVRLKSFAYLYLPENEICSAEQMDVHEGTATVREAMRFSAYLRQPESVSIEEKNEYVEEMIDLLELQDLSEALVFSLNVEARKRLTIGVELASKPELLLFLDEPTSGLDAQR